MRYVSLYVFQYVLDSGFEILAFVCLLPSVLLSVLCLIVIKFEDSSHCIINVFIKFTVPQHYAETFVQSFGTHYLKPDSFDVAT